MHSNSLSLLFVSAYIVLLLAAAWTDVRTRKIPNRLSYPSILFALAIRSLQGSLLSGLMGGGVGALIMLVPVLIYGPDRAGIGDLKWTLFIGLFVGFPAILVAVFVAAVGLLTLALARIVHGSSRPQSTAPFAPFLALGGICAWVWHLV